MDTCFPFHTLTSKPDGALAAVCSPTFLLLLPPPSPPKPSSPSATSLHIMAPLPTWRLYFPHRSLLTCLTHWSDSGPARDLWAVSWAAWHSLASIRVGRGVRRK